MKKVLMIEDDPRISLAFGVRLKSMGYHVITAQDAVSAVSQVRRHKPDVVLLDISLPGGDGFLVAERINGLSDLGHTPIIFVTASKQAGLRQRARAVGAVGFLDKPFDASTLANAIESALGSGQCWDDQATANG